jgi:hypothetical protein
MFVARPAAKEPKKVTNVTSRVKMLRFIVNKHHLANTL